MFDGMLAAVPSTMVYAVNIPSCPSSRTPESKAKHMSFEDFVIKFGSILSVLETFSIESPGSPKNKLSQFKRNNFPMDWDLDHLTHHY